MVTDLETHTFDGDTCVVCGFDNVDAAGFVRPCITRVVDKRRHAFHVNIMRGSVWGNPFRIGVDGDRHDVIATYRKWILDQPHLLARLPEIRGRILGCCCAPLPCHGDVLAELADRADEKGPRE